MKRIEVKAKKGARLPLYASEGAAGGDVSAYLEESVLLLPSKMAVIPTGLFFDIPYGFEIQVRPRSGLAFKNQLTVLNSPGTIDSDYRGELKVLLINLGAEPFLVEHGMRIAQIVLAPVVRAEFVEAEDLSETVRGEMGFGHTGL